LFQRSTFDQMHPVNGTTHFKNCLNTNIYSYLETSGG
jgi:hypothetical protein